MNKYYYLGLLFLLKSACAMEIQYDKQKYTTKDNQLLLATVTGTCNNQKKSAALCGFKTKRNQLSEQWVANKKARRTIVQEQCWTTFQEEVIDKEQNLHDNSDVQTDEESDERMLSESSNITYLFNGRIPCTQCIRVCRTPVLLAYHMEKAHKHKRSHYFGYATEKRSLKRNSNFEHKKAKSKINEEVAIKYQRIVCSTCGKKYDSAESGINRRCDGCNKEATSCLSCGESFTSTKKLRVHIWTVHNCPKIKCPHCKTPYQKYYLKSHIRNMHGPKVECPHCKKPYAESYLKDHIASTHTGKTISCVEFTCNKRFVSESGLKIHIRKLHPNRI